MESLESALLSEYLLAFLATTTVCYCSLPLFKFQRLLLRPHEHTPICLQTSAAEDRIICAVTCTTPVRMVFIVDWSMSSILNADGKKEEEKARIDEGKRDEAEM